MAQAIQQTQQTGQSSEAGQQIPETESKWYTKWWIWLIIVLVLIGIGAGIYYWLI